MFSVNNNTSNEMIIKKSKFITHIFRLNNLSDINKYIDEIKNKYKDYTHCCYAYIYENNIKASDDNEPSGTAGTPILDVLRKNNLDHVLCIVIRYFGGIKLGANGLIRAYSTSCKSVIENNICELVDGYIIEINTNYENEKILNYLIKEENILNKEYNETINLKIIANQKIINNLNNNNIKYKKIENIKIKKELN